MEYYDLEELIEQKNGFLRYLKNQTGISFELESKMQLLEKQKGFNLKLYFSEKCLFSDFDCISEKDREIFFKILQTTARNYFKQTGAKEEHINGVVIEKPCENEKWYEFNLHVEYNKKDYVKFLKDCKENFFKFLHSNIGCSFETGARMRPLELLKFDKKRHLRQSSPTQEDYDLGFRLKLKVMSKQLGLHFGCKTEEEAYEVLHEIEEHAKNFFGSRGYAKRKNIDMMHILTKDPIYHWIYLCDLRVKFDKDQILKDFEIK